MKTTRYFDEKLQAWVTVYPPGAAEGAVRGDVVAAKGVGRWRYAKAARKVTGGGKRRRSGSR